VNCERFFLGRHRVVNAGAGTGKTHALLTQYLHLLGGLSVHGRPLEPRAICALTFTEKAAGEMRERLGRRLVAIVRALAEAGSSEPDRLERLMAVEPDLVESARALGRDLPGLRTFEAARAQLSAAPIGTFHSFAAALLRRHALTAGIDPDFALLDEDAARDLLEETSERVILGALEGQYGSELATVCGQLTAEYGFRGGSHAEGGVVEALCELFWARAEEGQGAAGIAAAYTKEHLESERRRLSRELLGGLASLGELANELSGKSAERASQLSGSAAELAAGLATLDGLSAALPTCQLLRHELGRLRAPKAKNGDSCGEALRALCESLKRAASDVQALYQSVRAAPMAHGLEQLLGVLIESYDAHKRAAASFDFTDLLRKSRELLRDNSSARLAERERYGALLIDEFQDTSPLQAELLELLIGLDEPATEAAAEKGPRRLYLVGDRKQSIYGFRGADVTAYERLCQRLLAAGADEETLSVSRRSRPGLLTTTNVLFAAVFTPGGDPVAGRVVWDLKRDPLRPFRPELEGTGPLVEIVRDAASSDDGGTAPVDDPLGREARLLGRRIRALGESGWRYGDIVLLLRRYTHLLRYTAALKQAGIPHYVVRGRGFFQAQEVLDLVAFLTVLDDPEDRLALLAVLRSPLCGLSDESLVRLHLTGRLALLSLMRPPGQATDASGPPLLADEAERLERLLGLLAALQRCGDRLGPAACLGALLDHTDYLGIIYADPDGEQRVANVLRLCERARACELRGGSLRSFVRALRRDADPRISEQRSERDEPTAPILSEAEDVVRVMTVHQAKGLEFPVVLVAGCASAERNFAPAIAYDRAIGLGLKVTDGGERIATLAGKKVYELERQRSAAESGRLFYVAATRAAERLCFFGEVRAGRKAPTGSWMSHLEREAAAAAIARWEAPPAATPPRTGSRSAEAGLASGSPILTAAAVRRVAAAYAVGHENRFHTDAAVTLSLAGAADLLVCARRFHLRHALRLHEAEPAAAPGRGEDPPGEVPLGTLAAEVLCEIDLEGRAAAEPEQAVRARLALAGRDVRSLAVAELSTRLVRFLQRSYVARELAAQRPASRLLRAFPYDIALSPSQAAPRLAGALDLVLLFGEPISGLQVLECRYGYAPEVPSPLDVARARLLALVARRVLEERRFGRVSPGAGLRVGGCYLREADPQPHFDEVALAEGSHLDDETVKTLEQAAPLSRLGNAAALRLPVLSQAACQELRCGYRSLCHGRSAE